MHHPANDRCVPVSGPYTARFRVFFGEIAHRIGVNSRGWAKICRESLNSLLNAPLNDRSIRFRWVVQEYILSSLGLAKNQNQPLIASSNLALHEFSWR
jgi:hypothetical protein